MILDIQRLKSFESPQTALAVNPSVAKPSKAKPRKANPRVANPNMVNPGMANPSSQEVNNRTKTFLEN